MKEQLHRNPWWYDRIPWASESWIKINKNRASASLAQTLSWAHTTTEKDPNGSFFDPQDIQWSKSVWDYYQETQPGLSEEQIDAAVYQYESREDAENQFKTQSWVLVDEEEWTYVISWDIDKKVLALSFLETEWETFASQFMEVEIWLYEWLCNTAHTWCMQHLLELDPSPSLGSYDHFHIACDEANKAIITHLWAKQDDAKYEALLSTYGSHEQVPAHAIKQANAEVCVQRQLIAMDILRRIWYQPKFVAKKDEQHAFLIIQTDEGVLRFDANSPIEMSSEGMSWYQPNITNAQWEAMMPKELQENDLIAQ